jgi:hypothetical protein
MEMHGAVHTIPSLEHFAFETLRSALTAKMNFACASRAGGDAPRRRQSNFILKSL